ncbi:MAG: hypothetical protein Q4D41_05020 [Prevotellaceae bacterium]|nr:hypothetical protein [Prevotellaceae bacterium]
MKKFLFVTILALLYSLDNKANDTVSVSYELPKDAFVLKLMEFQGVYGENVILKIPDNNIPFAIYMVISRNGKEERNTIFEGEGGELSKVNNLYFFAKAESPDTVRISGIGMNIYLPMETKDCILMETYSKNGYTTSDRIPLIAYTNGHKIKLNVNNETREIVDYCEVRDAKIHPSEWHDKFDIKEYVYFEIVFSNKKK